MHADHRSRDQLEREKATILDPARELDVEREIAAEAELIIIFGVADQDDPTVALHPGLRHACHISALP